MGKPYFIELPAASGAHSGGDAILLEDLFGAGDVPDPFGRQANQFEGALSILTGMAANRSFETGQPVRVDDLVQIRRDSKKAVTSQLVPGASF